MKNEEIIKVENQIQASNTQISEVVTLENQILNAIQFYRDTGEFDKIELLTNLYIG